MDDFSVLLQAKLNQTESEKNINSDLLTIAKAIEKLNVQAEIDPNSVKNIAQQLANMMNQKAVVNNIQIDENKVSKTGSQVAQAFGNSFTKNLQSNLNTVKSNIENTIKGFSNQKLNSYDLSKMFNLNRSNIDSSVIQQTRNLTNELNSLAKEALKTNSDSSWEGIVNKMNSLSKVLSKFGSGRDLTSFKESLDVLDYFQNKKIFVGDKSEVIANTGLSIKELNNQFRNLGVTFTTVSNGATKLDTVWSELFNLSPNLQNFDNIGDQLNAVVEHFKVAKEALYGDSNLQPLNGGEVNKVLLDWLSNLENASKKINVFKAEQTELEQRIAQSSTSATSAVVQNEEEKQQAYKQTSQVQKQVSESESLIKSGTNVTTFEYTNNAAREASEYYKELLKDENAVISISERFSESKGLTSFTINVKRATGEVESLRYALSEVKDENGNGTGDFYFSNKGGAINNANAIKQIQQIENAFADYTQKLAQFKSTNSEILSGLSASLSDFEGKLSGLKNGTSTIIEVTQAYKSLNTEASNITANFSRQLSPIDSAIRNLARGEETVAGLRAEFKGLNNAPKEINAELSKCSSLLEKVKKIESEQGRTSEWSQAYKEWSNSVDTLKAKLTTLRKEQSNVASTQIFNIGDLKKNDIAYMNKVYNTIEKQMLEINRMANAKDWKIVDVSGVEQADGKIKQLTLTITDAEGALKRLTMQREKLQGNGKAQYGLMQVGDVKVIETAAQAQEKLAQSAEKANTKLAEQASKIQLSIGDKGDITAKIKTLSDDFTKLGLSSDEVKTKMSGVYTELASLQELFNDGANSSTIVSQFEKLKLSLNETQNDLKVTRSEYSLLASDQQRLSKANVIEAWNLKNKNATNEARSANEAYITSLRDLSTEMTKVQFNEISDGFSRVKNSMTALGKISTAIKGQIAQVSASIVSLMSLSSMVMKAINWLTEMPSTVTTLDTALVDLKKTADMSAQQLEDFYYASNKVAKQMGVTTEEILNQASAWSRLGFNTAESATQMAELSSQFASISPGMSTEQSQEGLVSIIKAWNLDVEDVEREIMDNINTLGNTFAESNLDIISAMERSAAALAATGTSYQDAFALFTGA